MKIGVALPQYGIDAERGDVWSAAVAAAGRAEALGLDAMWLSDHPFAVGPDGVPSGALEPLVAATALARRTSRLRVGTLVLSSAMRSPALVAHAFRTMETAAPDRIVAGLGAGWYEPEHRAFGVALPSYAQRVATLGRTIELIDGASPRPWVLVGGTGSAILDLAARRADGWNAAWDVPPDAFAAVNRRLDAACERAGRDPASLSRSVGVTVLVAADEAGLDAAVDRLRSRARFLSGVDRASLEEKIVCGTPDRCVERLAAYEADEVVAALLLRDDGEMLELFATRVASRLR